MFVANRLFATSVASRGIPSSWRMARRTLASVGDAVPSVELYKGFPPEKTRLTDLCKDKKIILLGLPGAFTPT